MVPKNGEMLGTKDAAAYVGCSPWTLRQWVVKGQIPYCRWPGGKLKFKRSALDKWLELPRPRQRLKNQVDNGSLQAS